MFKQRVLTAAVLVSVVIMAILLLDPHWLTLLFALIVVIGVWEWGGLCRFNTGLRIAYSFLVISLLGIIFWIGQTKIYSMISLLGACYWSLAVVLILFYQQQRNFLPRSRFLLAMLGLVIVVPMWSGLSLLRGRIDQDTSLIMFLMLLIWSADTGAYFFGKKWGKNKLANRISPGKSWEGLAGGLLFGFLTTLAYIFVVNNNLTNTVSFVLLSMLTVVFSVIGDLMESMVKREANIKDSGSILPGHGGVLDRIDSLTAAVPVFVAGLYMIGATH